MNTINYRERLDALLHWYATLTPQSLVALEQFYAAQAQFRDPFNDVRGTAAITEVFRHMFAVTEAARFEIDERLLDGRQAFVTWTFHFRLRGKQYDIVGGSHFFFNDDGLVMVHRDYWDAAEELLQKLPLIGAPVRWLRSLFAVRHVAPGHQ